MSSSKTPADSIDQSKTLEPTLQQSSTDNISKVEEETAQNPRNSQSEGQEEEGECGFCLFMKRGGCKESYIAWEKCIEEAEKNEEEIVDKCFEVTFVLKKCMDAHSDYYHPILQAEKDAEAKAIQELEIEKGKEDLVDVEKPKGGVEESKECDEKDRH